jgi:catechol 2,3-dioxygenase-like lactoylglutathione lyase family enzyme
MKSQFYVALAALGFSFGQVGILPVRAQQPSEKSIEQVLPAASPLSGQVTFLYCKDLTKASEFYAKMLGQTPSLDMEWVKIYPVTPSLFVGLLDKDHGTHRPSPTKPVMISFLVQTPKQVDEWFLRLKALGAEIRHVPAWGKPKNGRKLYSMGFNDPEGYTLEVFAWVDD